MFGQKIKRNVIFWGYQAQKMLGIMMILTVLYMFLLEQGVDYFFLVGVISTFIAPLVYDRYFKMVVTFGSSRKEGVWGMQCMGLLYIAEYLLAINIMNLYFQTYGPMDTIWLAISMLICFSISQMLAAVGYCCGMIVSMIVRIVGLVIAFGFGMVVALRADFDNSIFLDIRTGTLGLPGVVVLAVLLYGFSIVLLRTMTKRYEVCQA